MRKIIHIDMDCFYAAIEVRDHPELRGRPVAVGGRADQRGVLCTCNYEARRFGLHSAMASARAQKLCPDLVILPVNMTKYKQASKNIQSLFYDYTAHVEPLSLDEAFLDVTHCTQHQGSATRIAQAIRQRIFEAESLTASAGISSNKFLAKIASDWNKPNGQYVITPDKIDAFLFDLPVKKIFGVGKVTAEKLHRFGVETCGQLRERSHAELQQHFGRFGDRLYQLSRGQDDRQVNNKRERKSLSVEETYSHDLVNEQQCLQQFDNLYRQLIQRLERINDRSFDDIKTLFVKIKFSDFSQTSIQTTFNQPSPESFRALFKKRYLERPAPVRLLGVGVGFNVPDKEAATPCQIEMNFETPT